MAVEIVVVRRPRKLSSQLPRIEGLPWQWQRMAADGRGNCCGLTPAEIAVAIAADFRDDCRVSQDCRGNGSRWPQMTVDIAVV